MLFQAAFDQRQRESGAIDRHVHLAEKERDAADVVLVAVGQDEP